jgi:hypothetical protein
MNNGLDKFDYILIGIASTAFVGFAWLLAVVFLI